MIESLSSNITSKQSSREYPTNSNHPLIADFIDDILNKIRNFQLAKEGKKKRVRYTVREIRLALSLYNMNPATYKDLRDSALYIYPSENKIKEWWKKSAVEDGVNPLTYRQL